MNLTTSVDGVEIKFTVAADGVEAALSAFGLDPAGATRQTVSFFDVVQARGTAAPRLLRAGLVLRLREKADGSGKTTLKVRPAKQDKLTGDWAAGANRVDDYKVEYDWARTPVLAASVDHDVDTEEIGTATGPGGSLRDLFSGAQRRFQKDCGPALDVPWRTLRVAGPIVALRWNDVEAGPFTGNKTLRAERWQGAGLTFLEISARMDVVDAAQARSELLAQLTGRSITPDPATESKTEIMLSRFLGAGAGPA
ncbi:MAG: hypothetical protein AB7L91_16345 [Dehalococcoidia bacterium]